MAQIACSLSPAPNQPVSTGWNSADRGSFPADNTDTNDHNSSSSPALDSNSEPQPGFHHSAQDCESASYPGSRPPQIIFLPLFGFAAHRQNRKGEGAKFSPRARNLLLT